MCLATSSTEFFRRFSCFNLAVGALHSSQANWGQGHGHGHVLPDHFGCCAAPLHIYGDTLPKADLIKICRVFAESLFGPRPTFTIIIEHFWCALFVLALEIIDVCDNGHGMLFFLNFCIGYVPIGTPKSNWILTGINLWGGDIAGLSATVLTFYINLSQGCKNNKGPQNMRTFSIRFCAECALGVPGLVCTAQATDLHTRWQTNAVHDREKWFGV